MLSSGPKTQGRSRPCRPGEQPRLQRGIIQPGGQRPRQAQALCAGRNIRHRAQPHGTRQGNGATGQAASYFKRRASRSRLIRSRVAAIQGGPSLRETSQNRSQRPSRVQLGQNLCSRCPESAFTLTGIAQHQRNRRSRGLGTGAHDGPGNAGESVRDVTQPQVRQLILDTG